MQGIMRQVGRCCLPIMWIVGSRIVYTLGMLNPNTRAARAVELLTNGTLEHRIPVGDSHRLVPSSRNDGSFYVVSTFDCTCPDYRFRGVTCKHQLALRLQSVLDQAEREVQTINTNGGFDS